MKILMNIVGSIIILIGNMLWINDNEKKTDNSSIVVFWYLRLLFLFMGGPFGIDSSEQAPGDETTITT